MESQKEKIRQILSNLSPEHFVGSSGLAILSATSLLAFLSSSNATISGLTAYLSSIGLNIFSGILQQQYSTLLATPTKQVETSLRELAKVLTRDIKKDARLRREIGTLLNAWGAFEIAKEVVSGNPSVHNWLLFRVYNDISLFGKEFEQLHRDNVRIIEYLEELVTRNSSSIIPDSRSGYVGRVSQSAKSSYPPPVSQRVRLCFQSEFPQATENDQEYMISVLAALLGVSPKSIEVRKTAKSIPYDIICDLILLNEACKSLRNLLVANALSLHKLKIKKALLQTKPYEFEEWIGSDGIFHYSQTIPFSPSLGLAIGLGGSGINALRLIRGKVDAQNSMQFGSDNIQLLGVDTERFLNAFPPALHFSEYVDIGGFNPVDILKNIERFPEISGWLDYPQSVFQPLFRTLATGARQMRILGRIALFYNFERYSQRLNVQLSKLTPKSPAKIFIISSLVGGTGSGIFLDISQHIRNKVGTDKQVIGIFLMPTLFTNFSSSKNDAMSGTAFASLKELFYFQQPDRYKIKFPGEEPMVSGHQLFDEIHFIGAHRQNGQAIGLSEAQDLIAELIINNVNRPNEPVSPFFHHHIPNNRIRAMYEAYSKPSLLKSPLHGCYAWRHSLPDNIWEQT